MVALVCSVIAEDEQARWYWPVALAYSWIKLPSKKLLVGEKR